MIPHPKYAFADLSEKMKNASEEVVVPRKVLARLLDLYISCWDFDEEWYLARYPDIQAAVNQGVIASGWAHFRAVGYLEGRLGYQPVVDNEWYLNTYPDIAQAILEGKVASALEHYERFGYAEGRLPADPDLHHKWYAARYMRDPSNTKEPALLEDFLRRGYRELAIPTPPR